MHWYLSRRYSRIDYFIRNPIEVQDSLLSRFIEKNRNTKFGIKYKFNEIFSKESFRELVPLHPYEDMQPYIEQMMHGEPNVLWNAKVEWFSKSSGTTSAKSKYIPVTYENLEECHIRGPRDTLTLHDKLYPNNEVFSGKALIMGGSYKVFDEKANTKAGDVSAIMIQNMPMLGKYLLKPDVATALLENFDEKIDRIAKSAINENITNISGVPTWTLVLLRHVLDLTGKTDISEVWPNFELYLHAGVSFKPYEAQFKKLISSEKMKYFQAYNASEGYFAAQCEKNADDMLLLLDNGVFFEFIPMSEWGKPHPTVVGLEGVEAGKNYAIVITTNAGLWRYLPGDTVRFTSTNPYKIVVSGRTKHFINAFGEEVIVENTDKAIQMTCNSTDAVVHEYTVAPIYFSGEGKGGHEWLVEFRKPPENLAEFITLLDKNLQSVNSDYEAKRYKNMALEELTLHTVPQDTFFNWMKSRGKFGGQHKVPRLANHRDYLDEILSQLH